VPTYLLLLALISVGGGMLLFAPRRALALITARGSRTDRSALSIASAPVAVRAAAFVGVVAAYLVVRAFTRVLRE
jgi:hypothetical protein